MKQGGSRNRYKNRDVPHVKGAQSVAKKRMVRRVKVTMKHPPR